MRRPASICKCYVPISSYSPIMIPTLIFKNFRL